MTQNNNPFGELIRSTRRSQELTLGVLASKVGISVTYLSDIERGKRLPPSEEAVTGLAEALDLLEGDLLEAAARQRAARNGAVRIASRNPEVMAVAAGLARRAETLDDEDLERLREILRLRGDE